MKAKYFIFFIAITFVACKGTFIDHYSKDDFIGSLKIRDSLYIETYRIYAGGVWGGDVHTVYLTDSTNFRKFIGEEEDDEMISFYLINDDSICLYKKTEHIIKIFSDTVFKKIYSIPELKREGKWE